MRKATAVILLLMILILTVSCGQNENPKPVIANEEDIISNAERLIEQSRVWNTLFYIEGFSFKDGGHEEGNYKEVDPACLTKYGFTKVSDIRAYGASIFGSQMTASNNSTLFDGMTEMGVFFPTVCYDYIEKSGENQRFICVMANQEESPRYHAATIEYDYSTISVVYNENYRATIRITVNGTGEYAGKRDTMDITMICENGIWYLSGDTYLIMEKSENQN